MYKVPTVPPDLRHEETIIQAVNALDCLQKTINCVFEQIDIRVRRNNEKVQDLNARIGKVQTNIKSLVGTKKAIKINAPARFPASHIFHDIPRTFVSKMDAEDALKQTKDYEVQSRVETPGSQALQDKMVFFHVRSHQTEESQRGEIATARAQTNQRVGLGAMPKEIRSISSLLLFNSAEKCVYGGEGEPVSYGIESDHNAWKRARLFRKELPHPQSTIQKQLLDPAPHSLSANRLNQKLTPAGGLRYTPRMHEAPEIDLPLDLPNLPGIADDIHFEGKAQQQIAPSSMLIDTSLDLPKLEQQTEEGTKNQSEVLTKITVPTTDTPREVAALPLPVRTPLPSLDMLAPPPPPPPPPPPVNLSSASKKETESKHLKSTSGSNVSKNSDSRSELMDAIRKAGGARGGRLHAAAPIDVTENGGKANVARTPASSTSLKSGASGGDLMADLHNKLLMRRKGISGAKENNQNNINSSSSNPVISRLSALIPPPPLKGRKRNQDDDDDEEDGNDDTDWND